MLDIKLNEKRALKHLLDLLKVPGLSGKEAAISKTLRKKLIEAGCKSSWIRSDSAHKKISPDYEVGNLIVKLPGTIKGDRILLMGHMDTVPLCKGVVPVQKGGRIVSKGQTALGGDNRTAVACLVTLAETLLKGGYDHPPITLLFTIAEEVGLLGAKHVRAVDLGNPALGINIDSGKPAEIIIGAIGADRWEVEVRGRSAHAGMHPEDGISATLIASRAIADVASQGYFGKIRKGKKRGTSNVGSFEGGEATNQVTDLVKLTGESRSHDRAFVTEITMAYREAFRRAARSVKNRKGACGRIKFVNHADYKAFRMERNDPAVKHCIAIAKKVGLKPSTLVVDGGIDASCLNEKGIPTVTIGAGQHGAHTVDEYIVIREYLDGCRFAVALATQSEAATG